MSVLLLLGSVSRKPVAICTPRLWLSAEAGGHLNSSLGGQHSQGLPLPCFIWSGAEFLPGTSCQAMCFSSFFFNKLTFLVCYDKEEGNEVQELLLMLCLGRISKASIKKGASLG